MRSRIVSERDLSLAINMLMAGNIPASTSDVVNLVQRLQATEVYSEEKEKNPKKAKMEVVRDDV